MLARVTTFAIDGLLPRRITVEVDLRLGLPAFTIVGLGDLAVRESRERVQVALRNAGYEVPARRITVNLAPAHLRKVGPGFDLATACGVLAASGQLAAERLDRWAVFGELSLSGALRHCGGALAVAQGARQAGLEGLIVPPDCVREAAVVDGLQVAGARSLTDVAEILAGDAPGITADDLPPAHRPLPETVDLAEVRGHHHVIPMLVVAAAGAHNILLSGAPGVGKTMLARRMPGLLPPLTRAEAIEVTRIHSIAGAHPDGGLFERRPFRAPHHTISASGLVGGGSGPLPGEASLAHHGVLFLDELAEFARPALEALRQPMEDGRVAIVRGQRTSVFPARFQLAASTNPCPCGFAGSQRRQCTCSQTDVARYARRLSGPLIDRIDIVVDVHEPQAKDFDGPAHTTSAVQAQRVAAARERQLARSGRPNAELRGLADDLRHGPDGAARRMLAAFYARGDLSARGRERTLRVARTIADLDDRARIAAEDVRRAFGMRHRRQDGEDEAA